MLKARQGAEQNEAATIATNSYSIVSKRSVEKLYLPDQPSFLEAFVPKFKRRAPLINRGYWLRMRAIDSAVKQFLANPSKKSKAVVNLGCGYDPLPFRNLLEPCARKCLYIDLDYRDLIERKVAIILEDGRFRTLLHADQALSADADDPVIFKSSTYCAVGVDLANIDALSAIFNDDGPLPLAELDILFIAEVSVTYMSIQGANQLLTWTASFENARFCVLEQFLPDSNDHPFAATMLQHFAKQQAPIQSVSRYQSLDEHIHRYRDAGWKCVNAESLWEFWTNSIAYDGIESRKLDIWEPFDEWEEFMLFASHYFILVAFNSKQEENRPESDASSTRSGNQQPLELRAIVANTKTLTQTLPQKGGVLGVVPAPGNSTEERFTESGSSGDFKLPTLPVTITSGHTITKYSANSFLLVGGRTSPTKAKSDCFVSTGNNSAWVRVQDIQPARYRHCAVSITFGNFECVLVFGGRDSHGCVLNDWQIWIPGYGWVQLNVDSHNSDVPNTYRFGHAMLAESALTGLVVGGLDERLLLSPVQLSWSVSIQQAEPVPGKGHQLNYEGSVHLVQFKSVDAQQNVLRARLGATLLPGPILVGGVASIPLSRQDEAILLSAHGDKALDLCLNLKPRPLLIRADIFLNDNAEIEVKGGGGVCFSFGSHMNTHQYRLNLTDVAKTTAELASTKFGHSTLERADIVTEQPTTWRIHEIHPVDINNLGNIVNCILEPCVTRNIDSGPCLQLWNLEYLNSKIGSGTKISIHEGTSRYLMFHPTKNFSYKTVTFSDFKQLVEEQRHVYLRALATSLPLKKTANLSQDFPAIAGDFQIPKILQSLFKLEEKIHSSVLRISGDVAIWLHYDVMSNFLFQIKGSKTVIMFSPRDAITLGVAAGATVSALDIASIEKKVIQQDDSIRWPRGVVGQTVTLEPGDVLFIPRFWLHATLPSREEAEPSVAVNVFWKDLEEKQYAAGRDVYGNRDLAVYEDSRNALRRIRAAATTEADIAASPASQVNSTLLRYHIAEFLEHGIKTNRRSSKAWNEAEKIRQKFSQTPTDVAAFYLPRLAAELIETE